MRDSTCKTIGKWGNSATALVGILLMNFNCGAYNFALAAEPRWAIENQVGQFLIHRDANFDLPEGLLLEMQQLAPRVSRLLGVEVTAKFVHVVLFSSESEYRRYMQHYFPKLPARRALFIQYRGPGMLFAHLHDDLRTDLRHECVHALLNDNGTPLPIWLDEGLAEYFEVPDNAQLRLHPHLADVQHRTAMGFVPALKDLEKVETIESMGTGQYRDSWAWVHFLLHRSPETRAMLVDFLTRQRSGAELLPLSKTLSLHIPQWRAEFVEHFQTLLMVTRE